MSGPPRRRAVAIRGLVIDVEPLRRDPDFRRLWTGQAINVIGNQITRVALPYQVYVLTGSTLALAGLVLAQLVPLLLFTLGGGAIADAMDRRRVLLTTQLGLAGTSLALVVLSAGASPAVPLLFVVAFIASGFSAFDWPARASAVPRLVPPERLRAAIALGQLSFNGGSVIGPAIAGVLIGSIGVGGAYAVDVATFAVSLAMLLRIRPIPPLGERRAARPRGDPRGPPVRPRPAAHPLDVRDRSQRDGLRQPANAVSGPRPGRLPDGSGGPGPADRGAGRGGLRGDPPLGRRVAVPSDRAGDPPRGGRLGRGDRALRAVDVVLRPRPHSSSRSPARPTSSRRSSARASCRWRRPTSSAGAWRRSTSSS